MAVNLFPLCNTPDKETVNPRWSAGETITVSTEDLDLNIK